MAWVAPAVSLASGLFQFMGKRDAADAAEQAAQARAAGLQSQAAQYRVNAGQAQAASQRTAQQDRVQAALVASKLIAAAGAGGGTGPQIHRMVADIMTKGSYNAAVDIYNGEDRARMMNAEADAAVYGAGTAIRGGQQQASALRTSAFGSLASGAAPMAGSLYTKYGGGGVQDQGSAGQWDTSAIDANSQIPPWDF